MAIDVPLPGSQCGLNLSECACRRKLKFGRIELLDHVVDDGRCASDEQNLPDRFIHGLPIGLRLGVRPRTVFGRDSRVAVVVAPRPARAAAEGSLCGTLCGWHAQLVSLTALAGTQPSLPPGPRHHSHPLVRSSARTSSTSPRCVGNSVVS